MDDLQSLGNYFHYPASKSKEYVQIRQDVTVKYAYVMAAFMFAVLVFIPVQNCLLAKGYWLLSKVYALRACNSTIDRVAPARGHGRVYSIVGSGALLMKKLTYALYLNFGTIFQIALWVSAFTMLSLTDINGGDLLYLAKRLGRLCAVSMPTVFFLTLRPSPLPQTLYLSLLPIHKWLSRIVVLSAVVHTALFCGNFQRNHTWQKAWKVENLYGWAAITGFVMIVITSLSKVRDRTYKLFFLNHYFWSWAIVLCLPFHIRPVNTPVANVLNIAILSYQAYIRLTMTAVASSENDFKIYDVSPNIALVEFPNELVKTRANNPGSHIRITNYHPNILVRLYKQLIPNYHPYTVVSLPSDRSQRLVVRKSSFQWKNGTRYMLYGTFDPKLLLIKSRNTVDSKFSISKLSVNAKKILIVIGGSAISFAIPLLRVANYHGIPVKVVWVIRDFRDIAVLRYFEGVVHSDDFEIFVTGSPVMPDDFDLSRLRNSSSYGTFLSAKKTADPDLEANETGRLLYSVDTAGGNEERENVDVDLVDQDDENDDACDECQDIHSTSFNAIDDSFDANYTPFISEDENSSSHSRKSSRSHSTSERFVPQLETDNECHRQYVKTVQDLHLESHIYRGRPVLNYRYYNWCINESDIFTQCSGPVLDQSDNYICCKDLPGRQHSNLKKKNLPDLHKVWVISAGPKSLVKNTKLWANENGLNYHEEAFYV